MADIQVHVCERASPGASTFASPNRMAPTPAPSYSRAEESSPRDGLPILKVLRVWWILAAHLLLCISIALIMTLSLDKYKALDSTSGKPWELGTKRYTLRVSEVTTILSAALVVVRICVSSWTVVTVWRCTIFLLKEEGQIKLSHLTNMMDFRIPFSWPRKRIGWVVAIVVLLLFPQGLIGPLVTGAVDWSTSLQWVEKKVVNSGQYGGSLDLGLATIFLNKSAISDITRNYSPEAIDRLDWTALVLMPSVMKSLPIKAAGLVSTMWGVANLGDPSTSISEPQPRTLCRQRIADTSGPIPVKSIVYGSDLPCIMVGDISWQRPSERIREMVTKNGTFSIFGSHLQDYTMPGAAMLFDPQQETLKQIYLPQNGTRAEGLLPPLPFPAPETFTGSLSLLVLLSITPDCSMEGLEDSTIYGSVTKILPPESILSNSQGFCYGYATVGITAGVVNFEKAEFISSYTLQSDDAKAGNLSQTDFKPDPWVKPAMVLLPDVMPRVASGNTSLIRTWDNLPGYVETLIHQAYLASWGVLRPFNNSQPILYVSNAEPRLIASVNMWRLWAWFIINMFVPLSGIIWYFGAHWGTKREVVVDPVTYILDHSQSIRGSGDLTSESGRKGYD